MSLSVHSSATLVSSCDCPPGSPSLEGGARCLSLLASIACHCMSLNERIYSFNTGVSEAHSAELTK